MIFLGGQRLLAVERMTRSDFRDHHDIPSESLLVSYCFQKEDKDPASMVEDSVEKEAFLW